ncbi:MAG: membrane protein [Hoeflea sp. BRH_c9]|nr:MAG: membrane protein [Hoeflea sp. BRH_c9]
MIEFYWPSSQGEWLAWCSAAATIGLGLALLLAPRLSLRAMRLQTAPDHPEAVAEARATMAGFYLGVGICALIFAQPLIYLALGAGWAFTGFGRLISMMSDRGVTLFNLVCLAIEILLAAAPLLYGLGWI